MKIYLDVDVFEAAYRRIRWVFKEFPNVVCCVSGGKDSTVVFNMCLQVAREQGRLPLNVLFLDQEAEWECTIDMIREIMYHKDVKPYWLQVPFRLFNATSTTEHWLNCWDEKAKHKWMREKDPIAIKENDFGVDRFKQMFDGAIKRFFGDQKTARIAGIRADENPARYLGLTRSACHKWATWGANHSENDKVFYPLYDWRTQDVWKAIADNGWTYCKLYDYMYQHGVKTQEMRVSNIHHETALKSLFILQEIEPQTYERLTMRIEGIDMACKMGKDDYFVNDLPDMFSSWEDYRNYLLFHLVDPQYHAAMGKRFAASDERFGKVLYEERMRVMVSSILANDWEGIFLTNWEASPKPRDFLWRRRQVKKNAELEAAQTAEASEISDAADLL